MARDKNEIVTSAYGNEEVELVRKETADPKEQYGKIAKGAFNISAKGIERLSNAAPLSDVVKKVNELIDSQK